MNRSIAAGRGAVATGRGVEGHVAGRPATETEHALAADAVAAPTPAGDPERRRPQPDRRDLARMKRALRQAERRAGDGTEIGGTGATILKFLPAPLARLADKNRIGTEELRAADDIAIAFHARPGR